MSKFKGRLIKTNSTNACNVKIAKDYNITFPETVPVVMNDYPQIEDNLVGVATIQKDSEGLTCECDLNDELTNSEYNENEVTHD